MKQEGRYAATGVEAEAEPGSRGRVLRNRLGVRSVREMARIESRALFDATGNWVRQLKQDRRFSARDIRTMHRDWLGSIYEWAGDYRTVNITKGGIPFAGANQIARLMDDFEERSLRAYTPCRETEVAAQARALGIVHAELVIIHPFREGNGRCARLLATLMAFQTGLPILRFESLEGRGRREYFAAIQAAFGQDYAPITSVFASVIEKTMRAERGFAPAKAHEQT